MKRVVVREGLRAALFVDGAFKRVLEPGAHKIGEPWWKIWSLRRHEVEWIDVRDRSLIIKGQEILTADKVAVRVSILVNFRVVDVRAALHNVESYADRIYEDVQISTRRFLAVKTLDEILKDRNEISEAVRADVREAAASYGVEISRADVKDLVFPGNLREIMNRVLEAERQSEAMLIEARQRAEAILINANAEREAMEAKLEADRALADQLAASPALLRLKELDALERIAQKGGNHFYIGLGDGFSQILARQASE